MSKPVGQTAFPPPLPATLQDAFTRTSSSHSISNLAISYSYCRAGGTLEAVGASERVEFLDRCWMKFRPGSTRRLGEHVNGKHKTSLMEMELDVTAMMKRRASRVSLRFQLRPTIS